MEFLTKEELYILTGYKQHAKQIEYLKNQHYPIKGINRFGMPLINYQDVHGFRRNPPSTLSEVSNQTKWQPPPR